MTFSYPFKTELGYRPEIKPQNNITFEWSKEGFDLQKYLDGIKEPLIEIGGPSVSGYYFLDNLELQSKPIITNISANPLAMFQDKFKDVGIDRQLDGRNMPQKDGTVEIICMSCMSRTADDWLTDLSDEEKLKTEILEKVNQQYVQAEQEEELVAVGLLAPSEAKFALRIQIYCEIKRVLAKNGLYFGNGRLADVLALLRMDFDLLAIRQEYTAPVEELGDHQGQVGYDYEYIMCKK